MAFEQIARWTDWDGNGLEHLSVVQNDSGIVADSVVIGASDTQPYGLRYRLGIDRAWRVRDVDIRMVNGPTLRLFADGLGRWSDADGAELTPLAGCIDIDIAATPFTNSLPIRRLDLAVGDTRTIKVVYVLPPELSVWAVEQRYTRLADNRFLYEGLSTGFSAEFDVDDQGIVRDYPGVFRLLP